MKVAFCGPSGVGKTTALNGAVEKLKEYNIDLEVCPVGSREVCADMGFESPYDVDAFGKRKEFQHTLFKLKKEWEDEHNDFITDRTHLDNLVYSIMHDCVGTVTKEFIEKCRRASDEYDLIFWFPIHSFINTGDDTQRIHNLQYHEVYEDLLARYLISTFHIASMIYEPKYWSNYHKVFEIESPDLDVRVDKISKMIKKRREFLDESK